MKITFSRKMRIAAVAVLASTALVLGTAETAQAASYSLGKAQFDEACAYQWSADYRGYLNGNTVLSWRCQNIWTGNISNTVNVQFYCDWKHPGTTAKWQNYNDPYNWKCTTS